MERSSRAPLGLGLLVVGALTWIGAGAAYALSGLRMTALVLFLLASLAALWGFLGQARGRGLAFPVGLGLGGLVFLLFLPDSLAAGDIGLFVAPTLLFALGLLAPALGASRWVRDPGSGAAEARWLRGCMAWAAFGAFCGCPSTLPRTRTSGSPGTCSRSSDARSSRHPLGPGGPRARFLQPPRVRPAPSPASGSSILKPSTAAARPCPSASPGPSWSSGS